MEQQPQTEISRYVLPPGAEGNTTYGYLYIEIGKLLWMRGAHADKSKVKVKFWGDKGEGQILRPTNASRELGGIPTTIQYQIRCDMINFRNYLQDAVKMNFFVLDSRNDKPLGRVSLLTNFYIKHHLNKEDLNPLNEINDAFPVEKLVASNSREPAEEIGKLEIKINATFVQQTSRPLDESVAVPRGLLDESRNHLNSSFLINEMNAREATKVVPSDLYAPEEPELTYNRDNRIPKSLQQQRADDQYNAGSFQPQQIFGLPQQTQIRVPVTNTLEQARRDRDAQQQRQQIQQPQPQLQESLSRSSMRAPANPLSDQQMDNQLDQLFNFAQNLRDNMASAENNRSFVNASVPQFQTMQSPMREFPKSAGLPSTSITQLFTNTQDNCVDLVREKLRIEHDALIEDHEEREEAEPQRDSGKGGLNFNQIDGLKIRILEFICENINFREKINDRKIYVECLVPSSVSTPEHPIYDTYKFFSGDSEGLVWQFNNEFTKNIAQKEGEFKRLFSSNIIFKIFMANQDPANKTPSNYNFEIASGELNVEKIILTPGYAGQFYIKMSSKAPLTQPPAKPDSKTPSKTTGKRGASPAPVAQKTTKAATSLVKSETLTEVGDLKVFCKFTGSKVEEQEEKPKSSMAQTRQESRPENTFVPLQALLYIDRIPKIINRKDAQFPFRNVYIAFRIYGTSEKVQTETRWKTNTPYFDYKLIFPISLDHLVKMYNFPFTLEVWDKSEGSKDELLGLVKLNLEAVPKALIDPETEEINYATITASQYPILVCDEAQPIKDLKTNQENGQVLVTLAVGTALQLSKLENSRLKQKRNDYAETSADIRGSPPPRPIQREEAEVDEPPEKDEAPKRQSPQKKTSTFKKYEVNFDEGDKGASLVNSYESFVEVMERIRRHSDLATIQSQPLFMEQEEEFVNTKELSDFILNPSNNMKAEYCRKTVKLLDIEKRGLIHRDFFTRSYLTYVDYETDVRSRFSEVVRDLKLLLNKQNMSVLAFEKILNSHSESGFGFIKRSFLKETFEKMKLNVSPKMMEYILNLLDYENNGLVFITHLTDYLKALEVYNRLNYLNLNPHFLIENVSSVIKEVLKTKDITKERLDETFGGANVEDQNIRIDDVMQVMQRIGCQLTFFEALSLLEHIKARMNVINSDDSRIFISSKVLYTWLYLTTISEIHIDEAPAHDVESEQPAPTKESPKRYQLDQFEEPDSFDDINDILNNKRPHTSPAKSPHKPSLAEREQSLEKEKIPSPKNVRVPSPKNIRAPVEDEIREKPVAPPKEIETRTKGRPPRINRGLLKHVLRFTINEINQLNLGQRHDGEKCTVRYIFPSTQDLIESNLIEVNADKKTYPVDLVSKYAWTLSKNDDLMTQFQNSSGGVILQLVKKNETIDEILGYTVLPFEEFSTLIDRAVEDGSATKAEGSLHKTLLLYRSGQAKANFSFQNDLVIGKLSVFIEYERTQPIVDEREFDSDSDTQAKNKQSLRVGKHRSQSRDRPETIYENEIIVQRDFPKKGYFVFKIEGISELKRGLEYALERNQEVQELLGNRYGGGAKLAIYFDLFWEDPELKHVVAPFEVELLSRQIDFNEIIVNKTVSKYAEASSELIEYLQYKTARVEIRLHLKDKTVNEEEEELAQSLRREPHYVVICSCKIPLLSVLTSDRGLQGEFPLTNIMECYCGLLGLQISFNSESKSGMGGRSAYLKNREKNLYVMALSFNELLSVMESEERGRTAVDRDDGETLCYLEFEVEGETKRSSFYSLNKWREVVPLEDCFFVFNIEAHSEFFRKPLEVRLLQKSKPKYQDKILGFASIDFFGVVKEHLSENKTFVDSFYCPLTDIERAKALKTRLGVKTGLVRVRNPLEARKLTKYLNEILTGDLSKDSKKFRTQDAKLTGTISRTKLKDTFKQQTKLTYGELDDLGGLIAEEGDIVSWELFTREVRPNLHLDAQIDPQSWKSLLNEFAFYDYSEEGFISFDSAQTIVSHFSEDLPDLDENTLAKYKVKSEIRGLQMGYPKRVENMFDYVVFLNKLERVDPRDQYRRINDNTRKVDAFLSAKQQSRSPSPYKTRTEQRQASGPLSLKVELQYGKNFQQLNNGKPPSSCVKCEVGPRSYTRTQQQTSTPSFLETPVVSRSADPDFNMIKDTTIQNFDDLIGQNNYGINFLVYHRGFNPNHSEEMYKFEVIGEGFLSLNSILKPDGTIYFNDFLDIQPAYSSLALTQTARPMLKIKITGEANLLTNVPVRDQRTITLKQTSPKRYQVPEDSDEDIERFDDNVINNVMRTLAEVNQETRSLHGSAKKAQQRHAWEEDNEREINDRDFEERLQSHSKTMRDIADIHKNLDNIFDDSSFAANRERPLEQHHEELVYKVSEEQDEGFETGRFNPGITKTNPFTNHLDVEEAQPARKEREAVKIAEDIKQEMPEDLKDIESSVRRDDYEEVKQAFDKENASSENVVTVSGPSEGTEKKERNSRTSESGAKPPLAMGAADESSSTSTLRRIEQKFPKSMRNSGELARIARIMKPSGEVTKKTYHYSSDSDY